jgi:nitrogen fixation protein NifU and related proteins
MTDLNELYQELIIDHGRRPRNFAISEQANCILEGFNPLCGDRLTVYVTERDGIVSDITFQGSGCAISMASASLMTEAVKGKTISAVRKLFQTFHHLMTSGDKRSEAEGIGKLYALAGVSAFPARVKCATLAWHTLMGAIDHQQGVVKTE